MGGEAPQEAPEVEINVDNGTTEAPERIEAPSEDAPAESEGGEDGGSEDSGDDSE